MEKQKLKILFLTRYPVEGASSRYRVYQYLPYLKAHDVNFHVSSFMSPKMYKESFAPNKLFLKLYLTILAAMNRLWALRKYSHYDVIYMQRELLPFGPPVLERALGRTKTKLVFDYDDALFIHKKSTYNKAASLFRSANKTIEIFKIVDCVLAGNNFLRDKAVDYCDNAITFEVAEDTLRIQQRPLHSNEGGIIVGWLGSTSTVKYVKTIADALIRINNKYPQVQFVFMGGDPQFLIPGLPIKHLEWSLENELEALKTFDIGLMPLPEEEWSRGKSGGKARTYMAAGVVPICTAVGYNLELIDNGVTGFLCSSEQDWFNALSSTIEDSQLRQIIGSQARAYVQENFDLDKQAEKMIQILNDLVGHEDNHQ